MSPYRIQACAGKPYRPSNGTEGEVFQERFCEQCIHDDYDNAKYCEILSRSMAFGVDEPDYPEEWTHDSEGRPMCTAFEKRP